MLKINQALENSGVLLKGIIKTINNDIKEQNGNGLGMILGTLGASLLGNLLSGKKCTELAVVTINVIVKRKK